MEVLEIMTDTQIAVIEVESTSIGAAGKDGAVWYSGTVDPTIQGVTGDWYINRTTWHIWENVADVWTDRGLIKGADGDDGISPSFTIGTVTTGDAGTNVAVTITGTTADPVLNFTIPKGDTGATGLPKAQCTFVVATTDNMAGTYSRTLAVVTVTANGHGFLPGHKVWLDFTSGAATDGGFVVQTADANTFTITHGTSGSTSGNVTVNKLAIAHGINIATISQGTTGLYYVNFTTAMSTTTYVVAIGTSSPNAGSFALTRATGYLEMQFSQFDSLQAVTSASVSIREV